MSLAYTRKFIILKKELSTMAERNPKGYCKLEIKGIRGIVTVNIENAEVDEFYNVVFISRDNSNPIWELGKIFTDDIGRGKGEYTFIIRELESNNFSTSKISGILIMRDREILLGGYLDKEDGIIERYIESLPLKSQNKPIQEPALEIKDNIETVEPLVQEIQEVEDEKSGVQELEIQEEIQETEIQQETQERELIEETVNIESVYEPVKETPVYEKGYQEQEPVYNPAYDIPATEPIIEKQDAETEEHKPLEDISSEEIVETNNQDSMENEISPEVELAALEDLDEESMEPDYKTLDYIRRLNQKNQTTNYVLSILRFFPYIDPFKYNLKGYNWWIVELDKENEYRAFLPYFSYIVGGNRKDPYNNAVTCNQLMSKYGHYLFGLYNEGETVKYFVYGIPGEFNTEEHPYGGANGFNTWYQGRHVEGYWIIYIDPMTGKPISPMIPMIPID